MQALIRVAFYPLACAAVVCIVSLTRDAAEVNSYAYDALNLQGTAELAWKDFVEKLSFSVYKGGSRARAELNGIVATVHRKESQARHISLVFAAASALFVIALWACCPAPMQTPRERLRRLLPDLLGLCGLCLMAGLAAPIITYQADVDIPLLGAIVLEHDSKSVLSTIVALLRAHQWFVAAIVAICSVAIPTVKLLLAAVLLQSRAGRGKARARTWVRHIGKWSMADVFVVAVLIAFFAGGQGDGLTAKVGIGLYFFATYCLLSLLCGHIITEWNAPEKDIVSPS